MKILRRAAAVGSLVLVVVIIVGFVGRRSAVAEVRDEHLTRAAAVGAARLDALVQAAAVAAWSADSPVTAVAALRLRYPGMSVCATGAGSSVCEERVAGEVSGIELTPNPRPATVDAGDDIVRVSASGPEVAVIVAATPDLWTGAVPADIDVFATSVRPRGGVGVLSERDGIRDTSAASLAADGTYVIAQTDATIRLPAGEARLYLLVGEVGLVLFALVSATLIVDQRTLRERATFDALTCLRNRSEFERRALDHVGHAGRRAPPACLLLFDLDRFKEVNDTHGHRVGDELLRVIGRRFDRAVRDGDLVARWGGDEFVVLMTGIGTEEMGVRRARQIVEAVSGRVRVDGAPDPIDVEMSVGVALWPAHAADFTALFEAADEAMYSAKRDGVVSAIARARSGSGPPVPAVG